MELRIFLSYFLTIPFLVVLDLLWLGVFMKDFYAVRLSHLLAPSWNMYAASAFYILFTLGLFYFGIFQGFSRQSLLIAVLSGIIFGFFIYANYNVINMAILKEWPLSVVIVDTLWGSALGGIVASIGYGLNKLLNG